MARLLLSTPDGQQVVELGVHNTLGRHPTNSIQLLDKIVSKEHCVIERRGPRTAPFDEVSGQIKDFLIQGQREQKLEQFVEQMKAKGKIEILV